jgi:hypothetical protein
MARRKIGSEGHAMNPTPHIIPSALLLLVAFLIGCLIGYLLKRVFGPRGAADEASTDVAGLGLLSEPLKLFSMKMASIISTRSLPGTRAPSFS